MFELRRLRLLRELQLRGTLTAVAEALSYSPSTISQQLALLEREAGVTLFRRVGRNLHLTAQGELLAEHAQSALDDDERVSGALRASLSTVSGTFRLAVFQSAAHALLPTMLTLLAERHPQLRVEVVERAPEEGLFELSARGFDLVVAEQYPGQTRKHHADHDQLILCADGIRLASSPVSPIHRVADARCLPWVLEPEGTAARQWAMQLCRAAGFEPDVRFETADLMTHIRLISSGNAVGLLPDLVWAQDQPSVYLRQLDGDPRRQVFTSARLAARQHEAVIASRLALSDSVIQVGGPHHLA